MSHHTFTGTSHSLSLEEAVRDALSQISAYHDKLPGQDISVTTKLASVRFKKGGLAGLNSLEVNFVLE